MDASTLDQLLTAAQEDPDKGEAFFDALLTTNVFIVGTRDDDDEEQVLYLSDSVGEVLPFFTSRAAVDATLAAEGLPDQVLEYSCLELFRTGGGTRMVMNPHGENSLVLPPELIAQLIAEPEIPSSGDEEEAGERILVGLATDDLSALQDAVVAFFADRDDIEAAYLGWMVRGDKSGYLMIIVTDDPERGLKDFGQVITPGLTEGKPLDISIAGTSATDHPLASIPPFYVRAQ